MQNAIESRAAKTNHRNLSRRTTKVFNIGIFTSRKDIAIFMMVWESYVHFLCHKQTRAVLLSTGCLRTRDAERYNLGRLRLWLRLRVTIPAPAPAPSKISRWLRLQAKCTGSGSVHPKHGQSILKNNEIPLDKQ